MVSKNDIPRFSWNGLVPTTSNVSVDVRSNHMTSDKNRFQPHYHSYYCGFYVTEGEYVVQFDDHTVTVSKNQCMLIRPEMVHYVAEGTNAKGFALAVNPDLLMDTFLLHLAHNQVYSDFFYNYFIDPDSNQHYVQIQDLHPEITVGILQRLEYELQVNDALTKDLAEVSFIIFLAQLSRSADLPSSKPKDKNQTTLASILDYIQEHSASATLQSTAAHFHYNASYLSRYLSKETGQTFRDWQRQYRMSKAMFLLEHTEYSIDTIAHLIGYSNASFFYQAFQDQYHMTPNKYRILYRETHTYTKIQSPRKAKETSSES